VDAATITALVGALTAAGGGVAWWFNRIDKKRETREAAVIQTLKDRIEELKKQLAAVTRKLSRRTRTGDKWREQLIENHIKPEPAEWPEDDDEQ
jgi:hypothetical protein